MKNFFRSKISVFFSRSKKRTSQAPPQEQPPQKYEHEKNFSTGTLKFIIIALLILLMFIMPCLTISFMLDKITANLQSATLLYNILTACIQFFDVIKVITGEAKAATIVYHIFGTFASF